MGVISGSTAFIIGFTALAAGGTAAAISAKKSRKKGVKRDEALRQEQLAAQEAAAAEALAAPGKAAEKARLTSMERRRRRARTLLTGPQGVLTPGKLQKKTLLGE